MKLTGLLAAVALATALMLSSCAARADYRVYDPYYTDYHVWGPDETVYYHRWIAETHRPYRDYRKLNKADQHAYWTWRHGQPPQRK